MSLLEISSSEDAITTIVLNRPEKKNALSIALRDEFTAALDTIANDDTTKVVIVTGAGSAFSAGFDLSEFQRLDDPDHARTLWESSDRFAHPERTFGDIVSSPLHELVGGAVARDLALSGRPVMAEEALRLGLVSQVVPDADLPELAVAYAATVAEAPRRNSISVDGYAAGSDPERGKPARCRWRLGPDHSSSLRASRIRTIS